MQENSVEKIVLGKKIYIGDGKTTQNRLHARLYSDVWKNTRCSFLGRYQPKSTFSSVSLCVRKYRGCFCSYPMKELRQGLPSLLLLGGYSDFTGNWEAFPLIVVEWRIFILMIP